PETEPAPDLGGLAAVLDGGGHQLAFRRVSGAGAGVGWWRASSRTAVRRSRRWIRRWLRGVRW
ncbi:MAG: hypothetical protein ACRDZY_21215, partial [Acidimicrobiales bacterium]